MIGMEVTPRATRRTQQDLRQVRTVYCAAAAGTTYRATSAPPFATAFRPPAVSTTLASVWPERFDFWIFTFLPFYLFKRGSPRGRKPLRRFFWRFMAFCLTKGRFCQTKRLICLPRGPFGRQFVRQMSYLTCHKHGFGRQKCGFVCQCGRQIVCQSRVLGLGAH